MLFTPKGLHIYQEEIKKSRFVAIAAPVDSPDAALRFFAEHGEPTATHNCWAYRIDDEYRFYDDGEPGGTAGRPILQAIDGQQCDFAAVLVTRWFGGIKLGSGGLIRAYGGVAAQCLRLAEKVQIVEETVLECFCPFTDIARIQSRFESMTITVESEVFDESGVRWRLRLPKTEAKNFTELFVNITRGQGQLKAG